MGRTKSGAQLRHVLGKMGGKDVKALSAILAIAILATLIGSTGAAREAARPGLRMTRAESEAPSPGLVDPGLRGLYEEAAVDTYCLVWYDFEIKNWQGWTRVDQTAQRGTFFHVDDFAGLAGYAALEGAKSMWCGARKSSADPYLCSWATAAGYGNGWEQMLTTNPMSLVGALTLSYRIAYDVEPGYDYVRVEYSGQRVGDGRGVYRAERYDRLALPAAHRRADEAALPFHVRRGLERRGRALRNERRLRHRQHQPLRLGHVLQFRGLRGGGNRGERGGDVACRRGDAFGTYSGLTSNLNDKDPCGDDFSSMIVFFIGSTVPSTSYPGLYDTPFCKGRAAARRRARTRWSFRPRSTRGDTRRGATASRTASYLRESCRPSEASSIDSRSMTICRSPISFIISGMCATSRTDVRGRGKARTIFLLRQSGLDVPGRIVSGTSKSDTVQVSLGVVDMCDVWYLVNGNCAQHTPAPWFDNVRLYRYDTLGAAVELSRPRSLPGQLPRPGIRYRELRARRRRERYQYERQSAHSSGRFDRRRLQLVVRRRRRSRSDVRRPGGIYSREVRVYRPRSGQAGPLRSFACRKRCPGHRLLDTSTTIHERRRCLDDNPVRHGPRPPAYSATGTWST